MTRQQRYLFAAAAATLLSTAVGTGAGSVEWSGMRMAGYVIAAVVAVVGVGLVIAGAIAGPPRS